MSAYNFAYFRAQGCTRLNVDALRAESSASHVQVGVTNRECVVRESEEASFKTGCARKSARLGAVVTAYRGTYRAVTA